MRKYENRKKTELIEEVKDLRSQLVALEKKMRDQEECTEAMQKQITEYEKLSALGRLTANVAHEIRNPITAIGGLANRLKARQSAGSKESEYLEVITGEVKKLEQILRDALLFSDKVFFKRERLDINLILDELLRAAETSPRYGSLTFVRKFGAIPEIFIDRNRFVEAIRNLIDNAADAMPVGGTITIATSLEQSNDRSFVAVRLADTGSGIPADKLNRIFEPFYSTKVNRGETGLGLPITKKIVEGHGGLLRVESTVGKGSVFILWFPHRTR